MTYRDYKFLPCAAFRLFPVNKHRFFLTVDVFGDSQIYAFLPPSLPFPFVSSSSYAFLIASLSPLWLLVKCVRSHTPSPLFFLVFSVHIALEPVLEQVSCGISPHLCSVWLLLPGSRGFSFLVCCFCWSISANSLLKSKHRRYTFRELNVEKCLHPLS